MRGGGVGLRRCVWDDMDGTSLVDRFIQRLAKRYPWGFCFLFCFQGTCRTFKAGRFCGGLMAGERWRNCGFRGKRISVMHLEISKALSE